MEIGDIRIFIEPQLGATYEQQLAVAAHAELLGFGGFFRSDHYLTMLGFDGLPGPTDAWITLAGLALQTDRIRLGTLVSPATFRHPGALAVSVAQVDRMSGGRVEIGLGTGWYAREHEAYGIPFPPLGRRFDMLSDQLAILEGMWTTPIGESFTYEGIVHSVVDSPGLPKPLQNSIPVIVGGGGAVRTPALAARYASEFNSFKQPEEFARQRRVVLEACDTANRPRPMHFSAVFVTCAGTNEPEVLRRAAAMKRDAAALRAEGWPCGTANEVADSMRRWVDVGAERVYLQIVDLSDLEHLDFIAEEVVPRI